MKQIPHSSSKGTLTVSWILKNYVMRDLNLEKQ